MGKCKTQQRPCNIHSGTARFFGKMFPNNDHGAFQGCALSRNSQRTQGGGFFLSVSTRWGFSQKRAGRKQKKHSQRINRHQARLVPRTALSLGYPCFGERKPLILEPSSQTGEVPHNEVSCGASSREPPGPSAASTGVGPRAPRERTAPGTPAAAGAAPRAAGGLWPWPPADGALGRYGGPGPMRWISVWIPKSTYICIYISIYIYTCIHCIYLYYIYICIWLRTKQELLQSCPGHMHL